MLEAASHSRIIVVSHPASCCGVVLCRAVLCCAVQTPLHLAVEAGSADIVKLLLAAGANPNLLDFDGASPLHLVSEATGCLI